MINYNIIDIDIYKLTHKLCIENYHDKKFISIIDDVSITELMTIR